MPETLILPDLDIMDAAALKAMVRAQHVQHEQYIETLNSRASEIAHLKLLLDKLQRMLFGAKSEKLVRQVAQLERQTPQHAASLPQPAASPPSSCTAGSFLFQQSTQWLPSMSLANMATSHVYKEHDK